MHVVQAPPTLNQDSSDRIGASTSGFEIFGDVSHELEGVTFAPLGPAFADHQQNPDVFRVRLARPRTLQKDAGSLVQRRYTWRGYQVRPVMPGPNLYAFAADNSRASVGTKSIVLNCDAGLAAEELSSIEVPSGTLRSLQAPKALAADKPRLTIQRIPHRFHLHEIPTRRFALSFRP